MTTGYFNAERRTSNSLASPLFSPPPQSPSSAQGSARANALQTRIATVLSASYADLEISEALHTLDARGVENTAETRRNLRLELQQELIACNGQIVKDFGTVAEQLRRVGSALEGLNKTCAAIRTHVNAAKRETAPMLEENKALVEQRRQTEIKQKLLNAFNAHFVMSEAEITALTSSAEPVDDAFYAALVRTKRIHTDCQVLLGSEDQTLGLELLEQSSGNLNAAFQKLFRWTQRELKTIDLENPQLSTAVRKAFRVLAERPSLFQSCLDFFAENRERTLSDAFYAALTGTVSHNVSSSVPSKAIELSAHEPMRYVSDMLAWVHAATVGEKEALQNLFISDAEEISKSLKLGHDSQPWLQMSEGANGEAVDFDGKKALNDLVDRDLSGVLRQLRQRVEQTVRSHEDAVLAYQVANLASFYKTIFVGLLGSGSSVDQVLDPIVAMALEQFRLITRDHITSLHGETDTVPSDLSPPEFLEEALETLSKLMKSYDTSFAANVTLETRNAGFQPVLTEVLDPYLAGCSNIGRRLDAPDNAIFALNCLSTTRAAIKGPSYTATRLDTIDAQTTQQRAELVDAVQGWLVTESGLQDLLAALKPYTTASSAAEVGKARGAEALQLEALSATAQNLDAFLPSSMEDARDFVRRLRDRNLARDICEEAADGFVEAFEGLERVLGMLDEGTIATHKEDEEEEVVLLRDVFPRTSGEIKVLLS
ncbi:oligomeric Golgi complex subunit 6 [Myriangium duriaei CBS 260.36]|uniref:Conserved oligomeric Golgi complex subunit 6 n=1 Tax=Myriangium duriaei CBS 260.36 TaxID=1168546 RepID=A0A9P4MH34_9PEZI|nr:oligomeric Golgi complex subunit 6 [Myriangium duriaei CBS 260.36]